MENGVGGAFCVITGAGRGIGREIALQLSQEWATGSQCDIVLLDCNDTDMKTTKSMIVSCSLGVNVHLVRVDLQELGMLDGVLSEAAQFADTSKHQQFILVHNAGTAGDMTKPAIEQHDPQVIQNYMALNFTSVFILTAHFLSFFTSGRQLVINITSSLAYKYHPSYSFYSSGKAARNAYMKLLAAENPRARVLSYHPGPCDTDMLQSVPKESYSAAAREYISKRYSDGEVQSCREAVAKLVRVIKEDKFESGAIVKYSDVLSN